MQPSNTQMKALPTLNLISYYDLYNMSGTCYSNLDTPPRLFVERVNYWFFPIFREPMSELQNKAKSTQKHLNYIHNSFGVLFSLLPLCHLFPLSFPSPMCLLVHSATESPQNVYNLSLITHLTSGHDMHLKYPHPGTYSTHLPPSPLQP